MLFQDVEADGTVLVHVWMIDFCCEVNLGGLEGVICGKMDVEEKQTALVGGVGLCVSEAVPAP